MKSQANVVLSHAVAITLGLCLLTATALSQDSRAKLSPTVSLPGETVTLLPDGTKLVVGGFGPYGPTDAAAIRGQANVTPLASGLDAARAWHTATVASDGSVVIIGGIGSDGTPVRTVERFDPQTGAFSALGVLTPRSHHSATLLTDGTVLIVGGISEDGTTLGGAQLWNPRTNVVITIAIALHIPRSGQTATLQANGDVLIKGGIDAGGNKVRSNEVYDPKTQSFSLVKESKVRNSDVSIPEVSGSIPAAGAQNVPVSTIVSIRFSQPVDVTSVNSDTITLGGPDGNVAAQVVAAEGGRLAFVNPDSPLAPGTAYTVAVDGVSGTNGILVPAMSFTFTTSVASLVGPPTPQTPGSGGEENWANDPQAWIPRPNGDWRTHRGPSPWQSLPPYIAPRGVTALSGQVLTLDGMPLAGVTLEVGNKQIASDQSGRFLLLGVTGGQAVLLINGASANNHDRTYGIFQVGVNLAAGQTTVLSFTIWMPLLDTLHAVTIPSPTTSEVVVTNPLMPGLELRIPAGTVIHDLNGQVVRTITMTPVPLDRPPFPLPLGVQVPIYFTVQPGGSQLWTTKGTWAWAQLYYPNPDHLAPGTRFDFWNYDASESGWYVYGRGAVNSNGTEVIPDPGVGIWNFTGAMVGGPSLAPPSPNPPAPPNKCPAADPVDCSTGIFVEDHTDIVLNDVIPIKFTRTYRTADTRSRPFGVGGTDNYEIFLVGNSFPYTYQDLILPDGACVYYPRISPGSDYQTAVYQNSSSPGPYFGSTISWNGTGWNLQMKDGTVYTFPDSYNSSNPALDAVIAITDRYGNQVNIARDSNGNITQITSPNGRWLQFQHDSSNRITQIQDNTGRTVGYSYDTCRTGMLCSVTDANGGLTSYTYDASDRMLTMTDPRSNTVFTNQFDTSGRVMKQTRADGTSTWQFSYTTDSNGNVTQTTTTDPNGIEEQRNFRVFLDTGSSNYTGFLTNDVSAVGQPEQQTITYTRDPNTNLLTSITDQLNRQTSYTYDSLGNALTLTRLAGTSQAVTTTLTYTPTFSELASVTDPLSHEWILGYDSRGNLTSITDPLNHQVILNYNFMGQLTSVADALNDTAQFSYDYGDLDQVTDPLGNVTKLFTDGAGRLAAVVDALADTTQYTYDNLNRITQILDANSGATSFSYDGNGDLLTLTDASSNKTTYGYDALNRPLTRTDALNKSESYAYDGNDNLTQYTDRRGTVDTFSYDGLNRRTFAGFGKTGSTYQDTISYTWDGGDRMTQAADSTTGTVARTYDSLDRLTDEQTLQGNVTYGYDNANRRTSMTVAGQTTISYSWDNTNRLTGITQGTASVSFAYDNANRRTSLTLPNGVTVAYSYNNDSRITGLTYAMGNTQLGNLGYSYDADGRVTAKTGSLAITGMPAPVSVSTLNADNEMTGFSGTTLSYDANGNLTSDGTNAYTWDARNHLAAMSGGATASFVYDAFGRRMKKVVAGATTQFLYDGLNPVQELNSSNGVVANLLTGLRIDEYFTRKDSSNNVSTFLQDTLGSTVGLVGSAQSIATSYTYQPFGATTVGGAANGSSYEFTGREADGTGLYFYRARYYSPTFQRFIAQDPIGFAGGDPNLYSYAGGDPVNLADDSGLDPYRGKGPRGRSPGQKCTNCGGRHGGVCGPYCPDCDFKSRDPNSGVPPNPAPNPDFPDGLRPNPNDPNAPKGGDQGGSSGGDDSQFNLPPPAGWIWIIVFLPWPGTPVYGGL